MEQLNDLVKYIDLSNKSIIRLITEYKMKDDLIANLTKRINEMEVALADKEVELANFKKVSVLQQFNKQLEEKISYIKILESQLEKERNKNKPTTPPTTTVQSTISELNIDAPFDPDNFEELNGYELICYKNNYYLRDLETDELYSIKQNKPDIVVGLINSKGKVKLHK